MRRPIVARTFIVCLLASSSLGLLASPASASAQDLEQRTDHRERAASIREARSSGEMSRREMPQRMEMPRSESRPEARPEPRSEFQARPEARPEPRFEPRSTPSIAEPVRGNDMRAQQRQRFEVRQREQQQRIEEQRSPQGHVIQQALQREEQECRFEPRPTIRDDRNHNAGRPDWRDDRNHNAGRPDWRDDRNHNAGRPDWRDDRDSNRHARISRNEQQRRIEEQRQQHRQWQRDESRWRAQFERQHHAVSKQHRPSQHHYQQDYYRRWMAQQARWNSYRFDYYNDPFFYTPYNYRYNYGGRWYSTNSYGAQLLQQAVQDGYREGWYAGRADREDRWRFDYRGNYGYSNGSYGYYGHYVSLSDYQYYFRQGFERGYRDGYYGRYQYGRYDNGSASILPAVLSMILVFSIL